MEVVREFFSSKSKGYGNKLDGAVRREAARRAVVIRVVSVNSSRGPGLYCQYLAAENTGALKTFNAAKNWPWCEPLTSILRITFTTSPIYGLP